MAKNILLAGLCSKNCSRRLKILIITGSYPPEKCGVGDYCYHLTKHLHEDYPALKLAVMTSGFRSTENMITGVKLLDRVSWSLKNIFNLKKKIATFAPDVIHFQYPTAGYNGLSARYLPLLCKLVGFKIVQTWHEHYKECGAIGWQNVLSCDALIYVREDLPKRLPSWAAMWLKSVPKSYIQNAATIPVVRLSQQKYFEVKGRLSQEKRIVTFFGFANENKGVDKLFDIVNPETQHLVLICDLNDNNRYHSTIINMIKSDRWQGNVTVTGFLPGQAVGEILAVSDAVVFPFSNGAGPWNTSLKASENYDVFTLTTTNQNDLLGYNSESNVYYCRCGDTVAMKRALNAYIGTKCSKSAKYGWKQVTQQHAILYQSVTGKGIDCLHE